MAPGPESKPTPAGGGALANNCTTSTRWELRTVTIATPAGGQKVSTPKASRWKRLPPWNRRKKLTLTVRYRGGAACWYEVTARGQSGRFPGVAALHDVIHEVMSLRQ